MTEEQLERYRKAHEELKALMAEMKFILKWNPKLWLK